MELFGSPLSLFKGSQTGWGTPQISCIYQWANRGLSGLGKCRMEGQRQRPIHRLEYRHQTQEPQSNRQQYPVSDSPLCQYQISRFKIIVPKCQKVKR